MTCREIPLNFDSPQLTPRSPLLRAEEGDFLAIQGETRNAFANRVDRGKSYAVRFVFYYGVLRYYYFLPLRRSFFAGLRLRQGCAIVVVVRQVC
jgi:hypothetical protein